MEGLGIVFMLLLSVEWSGVYFKFKGFIVFCLKERQG